jgi:DeoR/GlpR family transcriptional regulator of sugar metabolism
LSTTPPALRRQQILERIQRDGGVSVADLARDLTVSSITVHRDLEHLSREGLVERVHGGARALSGGAGPASAIPPPRTPRARSAQAPRSSSTARPPASRWRGSW